MLQDFKSCCTLWRLHNFISVLPVDLLSPQFFRTQYSVNSLVGDLRSNFVVPSHVAFLLRYLPLSAVRNVAYFSPKSENVITALVTFVVNGKKYFFSGKCKHFASSSVILAENRFLLPLQLIDGYTVLLGCGASSLHHIGPRELNCAAAKT